MPLAGQQFQWRDKFYWLKAFSQSDVPNNARGVAVVLFNYSNEHGKRAFPGEDIIMMDTGLSDRQVGRNLKAVEAAGWIRKDVSGSKLGNGRKSEYSLVFPDGFEGVKVAVDHPTSVSDGLTENEGPPDIYVQDHPTSMSEPPDTSVPPTDPLTNPITDHPPLSRDEEVDDISSLYDQEINMVDDTLRYVRLTELIDKGQSRSDRTEEEHQELLDAGFTYIDYDDIDWSKPSAEWPAVGWSDPSVRDEAQRRGAVTKHQARLAEAERAQRKAQAETNTLAELKALPWIAKVSWPDYEKYCTDENLDLDRQLSLAQRTQEKSTSKPFNFFKAMVNSGVTPGIKKIDWDAIGASQADGRAWQE